MKLKKAIGIATFALFCIPALAHAQYKVTANHDRARVEEQRHHNERVAQHVLHRDMQKTAHDRQALDEQHRRDERAYQEPQHRE